MNDLVINNPNLQDVCKQCGKLFSSKYECSCKIKERVIPKNYKEYCKKNGINLNH